ncbi:MAG: GNAT family N-acetyltransferase [Oscillospiraceae bacterium]|nr:GNAT family N-acetyltransferase [Oscillospiraceae bacterium]
MEKHKDLVIRVAESNDAQEILNIYAPYIEKTAITFEYNVPSIEEFICRINDTLKKYPYIVAECNSEILGYAYTGTFKNRAAYEWAAEVSIYIKENKRNMGVGRELYQALENISKIQNIINLNACIAYPEVEDEYLTKNSMQFHKHLGYDMVGEFHKCGYKFGRWYNMIWMEKIIGTHEDIPTPVIPFADIPKDSLRDIGIK